MRSETMLPLGKVDPGLREPDTPLDVRTISDGATLVETLGYDGLAVEECKDDPYQQLALASANTTELSLATSVAMAFPRSPTITAMSAWTLQKVSEGRLILGIGSQVRGHIRRRYGMEWSAPAPRMRDYILAMKAVWRCWQNGEPLQHDGDHYKLDLMVPLFDPGPIDHPNIPVHIAAINTNMCAVVGEVADGIRLHPVCSPKYIENVMVPAVAHGAARTQRNPNTVDWCMKPLIATAPDQVTLEQVAESVRARVGFYLSTPAYKAAFEVHGWGDHVDQAAALSREQRWEEIPALVHDEMFNTIATVGTYDEIASLLNNRFGHLIDRLEFSIPVNDPDDEVLLSSMLEELSESDKLRP
ncbi:MAG: TIGR03617 family F420-dependent LLM class oxidoreductase [Actinomycetota bacterium]|nr:TIGR03617 family F420-dependent LLM class oxidoreductase [Actinomycetota bacterium]